MRRRRGLSTDPFLFRTSLRWSLSLLLLSPCVWLIVTAVGNMPTLAAAAGRLNLGQLTYNTAAVATFAAFFAAALGVPLGLLLSETRPVGRHMVLAFLGIVLVLPAEVHAMGWFAWFGSGTAAATGWQFERLQPLLHRLLSLFLPDNEVAGAAEYWSKVVAAGWVHGVLGSAAVALILQLALRSIDPDVRDAAALDASPLQVIRSVLAPHCRWSVVAGLLLVLIMTVTEIAVVDLIQLWTLADAVYVAFQLEGHVYGAMVVSVVLALLLLALAAMLLRVASGEPIEALAVHRAVSPVFRGRVARMFGTVVCWSVAVALVAIPIGTLLTRAASAAPSSGSLPALLWRTRSVVSNELAVSVLLSVAAALVSTIVACPWSWAALRRGQRITVSALRLAVVTGALAPPLVGLAVATASLHLGTAVYDSYAPAVWGLAIRCLPIPLVVLSWAAYRLPRELLAAAELDGAVGGQLVRFVWMPLLLHALVGSVLLAAAIAMADVGTAVVAVPPGTPPLTVRLFSLLHYGFDDYVAGLALWVTATVLLSASGAFWLMRRFSTLFKEV